MRWRRLYAISEETQRRYLSIRNYYFNSLLIIIIKFNCDSDFVKSITSSHSQRFGSIQQNHELGIKKVNKMDRTNLI